MHIQLEGVTRTFDGQRALEELSLEVKAGERIALVGPSGAGKTTLFRILNLSLRPDAGTALLDGHDTALMAGEERRALRSRVATIHQHHDLVGRLSALKNVLAGRLGRWSLWEGTRAFVLPRAEDVREAWEALERVGIPEKIWERTDRLSGGQRQRVAVARALFQDARLVLADEPIASVDPALADSLLELLTETARSDGRTLLVNLHQPDLARRYFTRILGLKEGRLVFDEPADAVADETLDALFHGASRESGGGDDGDTNGSVRTCRPTQI